MLDHYNGHRMKKILALLCSILYMNSLFGEQDLFSMQRYLMQLPEKVMSDEPEWENPFYTNVYAAEVPTFKDTILYYFGLKKNIPWNVTDTEELLKNTLITRWFFAPRREVALEGISYAEHMTAKEGTKFIIWGDIFGSLHSLIRGLEHFYAQGIIDSQFKIIKPDYYFVFLGNFIDRSPYSIQTLHLILLLMERNGDKVIVLNGKHETDDYWINYSLARQITGYFGKENQAKITDFRGLVSDFFSSLTESLYITQKDSTQDIICLSNTIPNFRLDKRTLGDFFSRHVGAIDFIPVSKKFIEEPVPLVAVIQGGDTIKKSLDLSGLSLLLPHDNASVWSVISCPNSLYQQFAGYYYDSFVELTLGARVKDATIQLFSQDIRGKEGFKGRTKFNLITGQKVDHSIEKFRSIYSVGSTMALSKGGLSLGIPAKIAMTLAIDKSNDTNYLNGLFVKAVIMDDRYAAHQAKENVNTLMRDYNIDTLLIPIGSPTLSAYFDLVKTGKVTVLFPQTGSTHFRGPNYHNIIHWRPSYKDEARVLIEYMISKKSAKKFAFFYQRDSYGMPPLEAAHEVLKEHGITDWIDIPYGQYDVDFSAGVQAVIQGRPDAIGLFSISGITKNFFKQLGDEVLLGKKIFGLSGIEDADLRRFFDEHDIKVTFVEAVPSTKSNLEIVKEYRDLMDIYNYEYDVFGLEAYICTQAFLDALKSIQGDITAQKILRYFESLKNFSFRGLNLNFNPENRTLSNTLWLRTGSDDWQEVKVQPHDKKK